MHWHNHSPQQRSAHPIPQASRQTGSSGGGKASQRSSSDDTDGEQAPAKAAHVSSNNGNGVAPAAGGTSADGDSDDSGEQEVRRTCSWAAWAALGCWRAACCQWSLHVGCAADAAPAVLLQVPWQHPGAPAFGHLLLAVPSGCWSTAALLASQHAVCAILVDAGQGYGAPVHCLHHCTAAL